MAYTIEITKPGYQTWRRTGVTVTKDECHVRGEERTLVLQ